MYRLPGTVEQLEIMERLENSAADGHPVTFTYFEQKKDSTPRRNPLTFPDGRPYLVRTRRTVEVYAVEFTMDGHPVAYVVDRSPTDEKGPMYRTYRIDRIAVSRTTKRPMMTVHTSKSHQCQGMIDMALAKREEKRLAALATA